MSQKRLYFYMVMLALPALLIIGVGAGFIVAMVPDEIADIPRTTTMVYRESAQKLFENPETGEVLSERPPRDGSERRLNKTTPWSYVEGPAKTTRVWVKTGEREWRVVTVPKYRPFPYAAVFYYGAGIVALGLILVTVFAIRYFRNWMKERDDFLAATAHDLTTPLVGLRGMTEREIGSRGVALDPESNLAESRRLVERLLLIVDNVKGFLLLGGRRVPPKKETLDLVALTREAYELFRLDYEDLSQPVAIGEGLCAAVGDATQVMQILWNLFGNDLKYAAPFGKVSVAFRRDARFAFVDFIDEGQGMSPKEMRRAFDRYYRAQTVLKSGKGGFGIGLCTARDFARAMGGDLTVRANVPKGCVFTLALPAFGRFGRDLV